MAGISLLRILGVIKEFSMVNREDRIAPFFMITITYCFATYLLATKTGTGTLDNFFKLFVAIDFLVIAATIITFFYKISIHSIGIWGVLGVVAALNRFSELDSLILPIVACILIAGVVMWARLKLDSHSPKEVWIGAVVGFAVGLMSVLFLF